MSNQLPRYPIYVPSKGRSETCFTADFLRADGVPFYLVIEEQERELYAAKYGEECLLILPFSNMGSVIPARNWIKQHATENGVVRHWQLDDNIKGTRRWYRGKRIACKSGIALAVCEDLTDRYTNVAISGLNYTMFALQGGKQPKIPFKRNVHVYSCSLVLNEIMYSWRGRYNEDTDLCLQVLAGGWCTILLNAFMVDKVRTMVLKGGNTDALYQGDGRLKMSRSLERLWPGVVTTERRFNRPQHVIRDTWGKFDTPLQLRSDIELSTIADNQYGLTLAEVKPVQSENLRDLVNTYRIDHAKGT